jgi:hypothetical protein
MSSEESETAICDDARHRDSVFACDNRPTLKTKDLSQVMNGGQREDLVEGKKRRCSACKLLI